MEWIDSLGILDYDVNIKFTYSVWHDTLIGNDIDGIEWDTICTPIYEDAKKLINYLNGTDDSNIWTKLRKEQDSLPDPINIKYFVLGGDMPWFTT